MWVRIITPFTFLCFAQIILAQNNNELVNNLIELRGQVEDLQAELKILQAEHSNSMSYLNARKSELESNRDRKQLQIKQAQLELSNIQEKVKTLGFGSEEMIPKVEQLLQSVKTNINTGIPFKTAERLDVIEKIERNLKGRKLTSQNAINQLWAFLEDEMRLTRENAIYSQTISLNGDDVLVDIAKLGTVLMYFKTRDERFGQAIRNGSSWTFTVVTDSTQAQQIETLFDSLRKQIRQGYFTLPLNLAVEG